MRRSLNDIRRNSIPKPFGPGNPMIYCYGTGCVNTTFKPTRMTNGTIEAWVRTTDTSGPFISQDATGWNNLDTLFGVGLLNVTSFTAGHLSFETHGPTSGVSNSIQSTYAINDGDIHHVAVVVEDTTYSLIIDGQLNVTETGKTQSGLWGSVASQVVQLATGNNGNCTGYLAEVRIWKTVRTPEQIRAYMHRRLNGDETGLIAYWPCDENEGTRIIDKSINKNNGTFSSTVEWNRTPVVLFQDTFVGSILDTSKWTTNIMPAASVTVSDALQLNNQNSDGHSGAQVRTNFIFPKQGIIKISFDWLPHKSHYSSAERPYIALLCTESTRDTTYYGILNSKAIVFRIAGDSDTNERTAIRYEGYTLAINIDETIWHNVQWTVNCDTLATSFNLDNGTFVGNTGISSLVFASMNGDLAFEFGTCDYAQNNTESFRNLVIKRIY